MLQGNYFFVYESGGMGQCWDFIISQSKITIHEFYRKFIEYKYTDVYDEKTKDREKDFENVKLISDLVAHFGFSCYSVQLT